ncbi:Ubiquitin-like domain superfamily [Sesbania bispinosa]|nr:Ubiquitin-like domain superfamily [Sesbania bispinosa]
MAETRLIVANQKSPRRSLTMSFSPLGIFSRKTSTIFYDRLPSQPLRLTVLKLDGSSFDIQVSKAATIAELKDAVEALFSNMPQKEPGKISWPHVWGQFCLCYDGQKLVTEQDYLRNYGIKDGDQLRFIRHASNNFGVRRKRSKKRIVHLKQHRRLN